MIGVLDFLDGRKGPNIAASVGILSQFSTRPSHFYINAAKRIFSFPESTCDYNIVVPLSRNIAQLKRFFDIDFAKTVLIGNQDL